MTALIKHRMIPGRLGRRKHRGTALDCGLVAWLLRGHADRWRRRALFYERHWEYFPRLSSGRFVARCRELEAMYRRLSLIVWKLTPRLNWAWVRTASLQVITLLPESPVLLASVSRRVVHKAQARN